MLRGFWVLMVDVAAFLAKQAHGRNPLNTLKSCRLSVLARPVDIQPRRCRTPRFVYLVLFPNDASRLSGPASSGRQLRVILVAAAHAGESAAASQPVVSGGSASMESISSTVASHSAAQTRSCKYRMENTGRLIRDRWRGENV